MQQVSDQSSPYSSAKSKSLGKGDCETPSNGVALCLIVSSLAFYHIILSSTSENEVHL